MKKSIIVAGAVISVLALHCSNKNADPSVFVGPAMSQLPAGVSPLNPPVTPVAATVAAPVKGIIAIHAVEIDQKADIRSDIAVLSTCRSSAEHKHHHSEHHDGRSHTEKCAELTIGQQVITAAQTTLKADTIKVAAKAQVSSRLEAREFDVDKEATATDRNPLGTLPELPVFLAGTPGIQDLRVHHEQTLLPGNYGRLKIERRAKLILAGGFYQLSEMEAEEKSQLVCAADAVCVVLIKKRLEIGQKAIVQAQSTNANDLLFYVEGANLHEHTAAKIGQKSRVIATIYAPQGTLVIGEKAEAQGIFMAARISIGQKAHVTGSAAPANALVKLFEAGEAGSMQLPGKVKLDLPACALAEDELIAVSAKPDAGLLREDFTEMVFHGSTAFEFSPSGLVFNCEAKLSLNYDPAAVEAEEGSADQLYAFTSDNDSDYRILYGQSDAARNVVETKISHFTIYILGSVRQSARMYYAFGQVDNYLYLVDSGSYRKIEVMDVTNPKLPRTVNAVPYRAKPYLMTSAIAVGNLIYVSVMDSSGGNSLIDIIDLANPRAPVVSKTMTLPVKMGQVRRMRYSASDNAIYLGSINASGANYLAKLDVSSPLAPTFSYVNIPTYVGALEVASGFVYANTGVDTRELRAYNAGNLSLAASYTRQSSGIAKDMQVSGGQLHLLYTCGYSVLNIGAGTAFSGEMNTANLCKSVNANFSNANAMFIQNGKMYYSGVLQASKTSFFPAVSEMRLRYPLPPLPIRTTNFAPVNPKVGVSPYEVRYNGDTDIAVLNSVSNGVGMFSLGVPPVVASASPAEADLDVALNAKIVITFDTPMTATSLTSTTGTRCTGSIQVSKDNFVNCIPMTAARAVMSAGNTVATLTPVALLDSTTYRTRVLRTARNQIGIPLAADFVQPNGWKTIVPVIPVVQTVSPAEGAANVALAAPVAVNFSTAMQPATLNASTTTACTGSVQLSTDNFVTCVPMLSSAGVMSNGNTSVTFVPVALSLDTGYRIRVTTDAKATAGAALPSAYTQTAAWRTIASVAASNQVINLASMNCQFGVTYNSQISVQGNVLAVSCNTGVLIFQRGGDGQWNLTQALNALDSTGHYVGAGVSAISGDYLAVQSIGAGVAIFKKDAGNYFTQTALLTDPDGDATSGFGLAVAMNSNQLMVGARRAAGGAGKVHVYEKNTAGENWLLKQTLMHPYSQAGLGDTLAASDIYLVSGGNGGGGYAIVFERDGAGNWQYVQDLTCLMHGGQHVAVAVRANRIMAGKSQQPNPNTYNGRGAALLYERDAVTAYWNQVSTLVASDPNQTTPEGSYTSDGFADRLLFVGNRPLISGWYHFRSYLNPFGQAATGTLYVFGDSPGWVASESAKVEPPATFPADPQGKTYDGFAQDFTSDGVQVFSVAPYAVGSNNGNAYLIISAIP